MMDNFKIWWPFRFFVAMTTEENIEHMTVLLSYKIHVILDVHISNISGNNLLDIIIYGNHFNLLVTMVTRQKTSYKVLFCDYCILCTYIILLFDK